MSEQITTERVAETEEIGRAVYWALRTEMIEAADRREVDAPLLAEALKIEAIYQAARAAMAKASADRHRILYAMWRLKRDSHAVAALMPPTVKPLTVQNAVVRLAPREDFSLLPLGGDEPAVKK
ncbi:hypothetical protein [Streptomyces rubradiris]|nr:hypothetical protein [Streptomyces rubradiris]